MSNDVQSGKFRSLLKARDIFLHDGTTLRRIRVSVPVQLSAAAAALSTLCWSVFATAQLATAQPSSDTARMEQQVRAMQADVAAIKQQVQARYQFTANEVRRLGLDPKRVQSGVGGPFEAVQPLKAADPNFKALFTSWKSLDQLEQALACRALVPFTVAADNVEQRVGGGIPVARRHLRSRKLEARIDVVGIGRDPLFEIGRVALGRCVREFERRAGPAHFCVIRRIGGH